MKATLDLLDELTNTIVFSLFHNRMWQSRYSEVYVHLINIERSDCEQTTGLPFYRDLHLLPKLSSCFHERNVYRFRENGTLPASKQRVSPFYHDLDFSLVGLVGNFFLVEQLFLLVVEQLLNPIPSSNHVSRKSLEEAEVTHILFSKLLLQFPSEQLSGYNKLGVFHEE